MAAVHGDEIISDRLTSAGVIAFKHVIVQELLAQQQQPTYRRQRTRPQLCHKQAAAPRAKENNSLSGVFTHIYAAAAAAEVGGAHTRAFFEVASKSLQRRAGGRNRAQTRGKTN